MSNENGHLLLTQLLDSYPGEMRCWGEKPDEEAINEARALLSAYDDAERALFDARHSAEQWEESATIERARADAAEARFAAATRALGHVSDAYGHEGAAVWRALGLLGEPSDVEDVVHAVTDVVARAVAAEQECTGLRTQVAYLAPRQRAGQLVANAMHAIDATFYENTRNTGIDPWEHHDRVSAYLEAWRTHLLSAGPMVEVDDD